MGRSIFPRPVGPGVPRSSTICSADGG